MAALIEMAGDLAADNKNTDNTLETTKSKSEFSVPMRVNMCTKLNPLAKEFYPSYYSPSTNQQLHPSDSFILNNKQLINEIFPNNQRRGNSFNQGNSRSNGRAFRAPREDSIRRTIYVYDIDQNITEEWLARLFSSWGQVVDCRVCGELRSVNRFAFVEFSNEHGARVALNMDGTTLGYYPIRVLPSKTVIRPVNPTFIPRSDDEREICYRTVFCSNIDNKVSQVEVKRFFETACGEVNRMRLLGDYVHSTRIAFVEFTMIESAIAALNCSGMALGTLPIRVSPSKTLMMPRGTRPTLR